MKVLGGILIAVGILIAGVSGLCTFAVLSGPGELTGPQVLESLAIVALFGSVPFAVGAIMAFLGYRMVRPERHD